MAGYTKLFQEIVASSIWDEDDKTRLVWITMLALKDGRHFVRGTERYLALAARVTQEECQAALGKLSAPDALSRSVEHAGKRIEAQPGGWLILNGEKYSRMLSKEERQEYNRLKQAEYRKRRKTIAHEAECAGASQAIADGLEEQLRAVAAKPEAPSAAPQ